jgi:hypothetical protein
LQPPPKAYPVVAFWLSLAGGVLVLLAGVVVIAFGAALSFLIGGLGEIFGLAGVIWGILILLFAGLLKSMPDKHSAFGVVLILFSVFSWFGSFGGFVLGFLLSLIGGIMALAWKPPAPAPATPGPAPAPTVATTAGPLPPKFCGNCGSPVEPGEKFCKICGKAL